MIYNFFLYPMRIFFLLAGVFGVLGGMVLLLKVEDFINLHQFIFLESFCGCAFSGFLFTAIPLWTNYKKSLIPFSVPCFLLLILAYFTEIFTQNGTLIMIIFWIFLFCSCLFFMYKDRNPNHLSITLVILCVILANYLSFRGIFSADSRMLVHFYIAGIVIIGFRVGMVLAQSALDEVYVNNSYVFLPNPILKNLAFIAFLLLGMCEMISGFHTLKGFVSLGAGLIMLGRIYEWHHKAFFKVHYTIMYYLLFLGIGLSYVFYGLDYLFELGHHYSLLHGIVILGIVGIVFLIFNVASLRHSGLNLIFPLSSRVGFVFLLGAMILRVCMRDFGEVFYVTLPAILFICVFIAFFVTFYRIYKNNPFSNDPK